MTINPDLLRRQTQRRHVTPYESSYGLEMADLSVIVGGFAFLFYRRLKRFTGDPPPVLVRGSLVTNRF